MDYSYATADEKDIGTIKAINEECMPETYDLQTYQQLYKSTLICKERETEKIVGYLIMANLATLDPELDQFSRTHHSKKIHTVVFSLAVLPEHRRKGIGTKLLKLACNAHKKYTIILHTRESNIVAKNIYEKNGFKTFKKITNYYHTPEEDGLVMVRMGKK